MSPANQLRHRSRRHSQERGPRLSAEERHTQIVRVASELFAEKGFRGTTTREIAQECGISEATIFQHFETKDDLYGAIILSHLQSMADDGLGDEFSEAGADPDDEAVFGAFARKFLEHNTADPVFWRLVGFSRLERHDLAERFFHDHVREGLAHIACYIRTRQEATAWRDDIDSHAAAYHFLGMLVHHVNTLNVFQQRQEWAPDMPLDKVAGQIASLFVAGMKNHYA